MFLVEKYKYICMRFFFIAAEKRKQQLHLDFASQSSGLNIIPNGIVCPTQL